MKTDNLTALIDHSPKLPELLRLSPSSPMTRARARGILSRYIGLFAEEDRARILGKLDKYMPHSHLDEFYIKLDHEIKGLETGYFNRKSKQGRERLAAYKDALLKSDRNAPHGESTEEIFWEHLKTAQEFQSSKAIINDVLPIVLAVLGISEDSDELEKFIRDVPSAKLKEISKHPEAFQATLGWLRADDKIDVLKTMVTARKDIFSNLPPFQKLKSVYDLVREEPGAYEILKNYAFPASLKTVDIATATKQLDAIIERLYPDSAIGMLLGEKVELSGKTVKVSDEKTREVLKYKLRKEYVDVTFVGKGPDSFDITTSNGRLKSELAIAGKMAAQQR